MNRILRDFDLDLAAPRDETRRDETRRDETRRDETRRDETRRDETRRDETRRDETRRDETRRDETRRDETRRDETRRDETRRDETRRSSTQQAAIDKHIGGIVCADLFDYASLRERGLHVGSGVTEGACKSLVMLRAKRSGQRWRPEGIRAVLTLRSLVLNDRISPRWNRILQSTNVLQPLAA